MNIKTDLDRLELKPEMFVGLFNQPMGMFDDGRLLYRREWRFQVVQWFLGLLDCCGFFIQGIS